MKGTTPPDCYYAFTWAPDPGRYKSSDPQKQYSTCLSYLQRSRRCLDEYRFYPELTLNGNVHIHGVYRIKDKIKYFKDFLPMIKQNGFVIIKKIDDGPKWNDYITKDEELMVELMDELPVPFDEFTIYKHKITVHNTLSKIKPKQKKKKISDYF